MSYSTMETTKTAHYHHAYSDNDNAVLLTGNDLSSAGFFNKIKPIAYLVKKEIVLGKKKWSSETLLPPYSVNSSDKDGAKIIPLDEHSVEIQKANHTECNYQSRTEVGKYRVNQVLNALETCMLLDSPSFQSRFAQEIEKQVRVSLDPQEDFTSNVLNQTNRFASMMACMTSDQELPSDFPYKETLCNVKNVLLHSTLSEIVTNTTIQTFRRIYAANQEISNFIKNPLHQQQLLYFVFHLVAPEGTDHFDSHVLAQYLYNANKQAMHLKTLLSAETEYALLEQLKGTDVNPELKNARQSAFTPDKLKVLNALAELRANSRVEKFLVDHRVFSIDELDQKVEKTMFTVLANFADFVDEINHTQTTFESMINPKFILEDLDTNQTVLSLIRKLQDHTLSQLKDKLIKLAEHQKIPVSIEYGSFKEEVCALPNEKEENNYLALADIPSLTSTGHNQKLELDTLSQQDHHQLNALLDLNSYLEEICLSENQLETTLSKTLTLSQNDTTIEITGFEHALLLMNETVCKASNNLRALMEIASAAKIDESLNELKNASEALVQLNRTHQDDPNWIVQQSVTPTPWRHAKQSLIKALPIIRDSFEFIQNKLANIKDTSARGTFIQMLLLQRSSQLPKSQVTLDKQDISLSLPMVADCLAALYSFRDELHINVSGTTKRKIEKALFDTGFYKYIPTPPNAPNNEVEYIQNVSAFVDYMHSSVKEAEQCNAYFYHLKDLTSTIDALPKDLQLLFVSGDLFKSGYLSDDVESSFLAKYPALVSYVSPVVNTNNWRKLKIFRDDFQIPLPLFISRSIELEKSFEPWQSVNFDKLHHIPPVTTTTDSVNHIPVQNYSDMQFLITLSALNTCHMELNEMRFKPIIDGKATHKAEWVKTFCPQVKTYQHLKGLDLITLTKNFWKNDEQLRSALQTNVFFNGVWIDSEHRFENFTSRRALIIRDTLDHLYDAQPSITAQFNDDREDITLGVEPLQRQTVNLDGAEIRLNEKPITLNL